MSTLNAGRLGRSRLEPHPCHPAVQLHDPAQAPASVAVDQVDRLADAGMAGTFEEEAHRRPDAALVVGLVKVRSQHHLALGEVELRLLSRLHYLPSRRGRI